MYKSEGYLKHNNVELLLLSFGLYRLSHRNTEMVMNFIMHLTDTIKFILNRNTDKLGYLTCCENKIETWKSILIFALLVSLL